MTGDLFGAPPPPDPVRPPPARPVSPARTAPPADRPPVFGSPAWTHCPCGGFATLHFPRAGGLRRCHPCATAEGRMKGPNDE